MSLQYSVRSRMAYARLYRPYNSIDIFVEDAQYTGLYERLINRLINGRGRVSRVVALGSRSNVEREAPLYLGNGRRSFFIVDGDLDLIAYRYQRSPANLYRLKVYCLENLFIGVESVMAALQTVLPHMTAEQIQSQFGWPKFENDINNLLFQYFAVLAVCRRLEIRDSVMTINHNACSRRVNGQYIEPCPDAIRRTVSLCLRTAVRLRGAPAVRSAISAVRNNIASKSIEGLDACSGKFLIKYVYAFINQNGGSCEARTFISILSSNCDRVRDSQLKKRLLRELK